MAFDSNPEEQAKKKLNALVQKKLQEARKRRGERAALINETYRLTAPWRRMVQSSIGTPTTDPALTEEDIADVVDATMAEVQADFASDMIAQFTPDSEPWTSFKVREDVPPELKKQVDMLVAQTSEKIFLTLRESSYYDAAPQCFQELCNGTMAIRCRRPERGGDPFEFEPLEPADLLLCHSPTRGVADMRATEAAIPYSDFKTIYGKFARLPADMREPQPDDIVNLCDGFYRCWENRKGDQAWRRFVTLNDKIVYEAFLADDPDVDIIVSRWEVNGKSPWGVGPAFRAQPAQRALNELTAILMVAAAKHADTPGFYTDDGVANLEQGFDAGDMLAVSENFKVHWWEPGGQLDISFFTENNLREMIRRAYFQDRPEQKGKTPPTATQWSELDVRQRQRWEIPRGKIVREWVLPLVAWTKNSLEMMGAIGPYKIDQRLYTVLPNSPFARARQQEKIVRAQGFLQGFAALSPQSFPVDVDIGKTMENFKSELQDELVVIRSPQEKQQIIAAAASAQGGQPMQGPPNAKPPA